MSAPAEKKKTILITKKSNKLEDSFKIGDLVLYKNNQLIAFNKPAGIPVQPDLTQDRALLNLAEIYTKGQVLLLHRLDRPVSGVILFAKNKTALQILNEDFRTGKVKKTYLAVVQNTPPQPEGTLVHFLTKDARSKKAVVTTKEDKEAQEAILHYRVLGSSDRYCLLEVAPQTGRFHQIRCQLAAIGCPVKGDVKYGARRKNNDRSIHLHAWKLQFTHPVDHTPVAITAPLPKETLWQAFENVVSDHSED
jgi:23S rRNA pseudouridine1911/1915/1917 synthase